MLNDCDLAAFKTSTIMSSENHLKHCSSHQTKTDFYLLCSHNYSSVTSDFKKGVGDSLYIQNFPFTHGGGLS